MEASKVLNEPDSPLTDEEAMALGDTKLREILSGGGKITKSFRCKQCTHDNLISFEVADVAMVVKIMEFMTKRKAAGADDAPKKARITLDWFREASDEELAAEFHLEG